MIGNLLVVLALFLAYAAVVLLIAKFMGHSNTKCRKQDSFPWRVDDCKELKCKKLGKCQYE
jgi:hypothetical protein